MSFSSVLKRIFEVGCAPVKATEFFLHMRERERERAKLPMQYGNTQLTRRKLLLSLDLDHERLKNQGSHQHMLKGGKS